MPAIWTAVNETGDALYSDRPEDMRILFEVADATWRTEAARILHLQPNAPDLAGNLEAQGRLSGHLREAFKARERARAQWEKVCKSD